MKRHHITAQETRVIQELYRQTGDAQEVVRQTGISQSAIYQRLRPDLLGEVSTVEYQQEVADKAGFASYTEYQRYLKLRLQYKKNFPQEMERISLLGLEIGNVKKKGVNTLEVTILEKNLEASFVLDIFHQNIEECLDLIGHPEKNFTLTYHHHCIAITAHDPVTRALLYVYPQVVQREARW